MGHAVHPEGRAICSDTDGGLRGRIVEAANKVRALAGYAMLVSCVVGTLAYFGVSMPSGTALGAVAFVFVIGALRAITR